MTPDDLTKYIVAVNDGTPYVEEDEDTSFETCPEIEELVKEGGSGVVNAPNILTKTVTSAAIVGFYRMSLQNHLRELVNYGHMKVMPARNLDQEVDYAHQVIVLGRGTVQGEILGVPGQTNPSIAPKPIPDISVQDSKSRTHSVVIPINVNITVQTLAEAEKLGWIVYNYFLAISGDVLADILPGLTNVTAPSLTAVVPSQKFKDLLELDVDFNVSLKVNTVMKVPANYIQSIYLRVQDEWESFDEVAINQPSE